MFRKITNCFGQCLSQTPCNLINEYYFATCCGIFPPIQTARLNETMILFYCVPRASRNSHYPHYRKDTQNKCQPWLNIFHHECYSSCFAWIIMNYINGYLVYHYSRIDGTLLQILYNFNCKVLQQEVINQFIHTANICLSII